MTGLRRALLGIALLGVVASAAAVLIVVNSDHATERGLLAAITAVVGMSFIGTGLYAWDRRPDNGTGPLMVWVGFAWFLIGFGAANTPVLFVVATLLGNLFYGALIHLLLAFPSGKLQTRTEKGLTVGAYFAAVVMSWPALLVF